jgi:hypothetical protein
MKLREFASDATAQWFKQIFEWSRKKITFEDNVDCQFLTVNIGTAETEVGHSLGRTPRYVIEVASYPNGTAGVSFTKEPTNTKLFLKRAVAGSCTLLLM